VTPLWIFCYHYGQWDRKLQTAIKPQRIDRSGWNLVHMWPTLAPSIRKFSVVGNSPNSKKWNFVKILEFLYLKNGRFFAKTSGIVGIHIAHMAFSNWVRPPNLGMAGAKFAKIWGQARGRRPLAAKACNLDPRSLVRTIDDGLPKYISKPRSLSPELFAPQPTKRLNFWDVRFFFNFLRHPVPSVLAASLAFL